MDALEEQIRILKNIVDKQSIELEFKTELLNLPAGLPTESWRAGKSQFHEQRRSR